MGAIPKGFASASSIDLWRTCRLQWKKIKRDGRGRERIETPPMLLGKLCHETFEAAYHAVKKNPPEEKIVDLLTLAKLLSEVVEKRIATLEKPSGKPLDRAALKAAKKALAEAVEVAGEILELAAPLDLSRTVQVETPWSVMTSFGEIVGVTDRTDLLVDTKTGEVSDNPDNGVEIVDYKTGGRVVEDHLVPLLVQVQLYVIAAREKFPNAKRIQFRMYWVARDSWSAPVFWTKAYEEKARLQIESDLRSMVEAIEGPDEPEECGHGNAAHSCSICSSNPEERRMAQGHLDRFPPSKGVHCDDCPFKFECGAYKAEVSRATDTAVIQKLNTISPAELSSPVLLRTRQNIKIAEEILKGLRKAYDAEIADRIPDGSYSMTAADLTARIASRGFFQAMPEDDVVQFLMPMLWRGPGLNPPVAPGDEPTAATVPINPEAEVTFTEREAFLAAISSIDKKKLAALVAELPKDQRRAANKLMKERRVKTGEANWIEVDDVQPPF